MIQQLQELSARLKAMIEENDRLIQRSKQLLNRPAAIT